MSRVAAIVAVLAGFGLGVGAGWLAFSDGDDGPPCWQVQAALEDAWADWRASVGPEGHDGVRGAADEAAARPDCFSPDEREALRRLAETPPRPAPEDASHAEVTVQPTEHG